MDRTLILSILILIILSAVCSMAQTADTTASSPSPAAASDYVDLSEQATIIKVEPERPRVNLITERIKPQFEDVNLEKSFMDEILDKKNVAALNRRLEGNSTREINIETIVNRQR